MANSQFDVVVTNPRERPVSDDQNLQASQASRTLRWVHRLMFAGRTNGSTPFANDGSTPRVGFIGDGFKVGPSSPAAMSVQVRPGLGYLDTVSDYAADIGGALGLNDSERYKPVPLEAAQTLAVPAADPSNPRIDIVEVKYDRRVENPLSRDVLDTGTGQFVATVVQKTLAWLLDGRTSVNGSGGTLKAINYKTGTPAGSPAAPAVTAGYVKVAEVLVAAAATTINQNNVRDTRGLLAPNGQLRASFRVTIRGTVSGIGAPTIQAANLPPGCSLAVWQVLSGGNYNVAVIAGGVPAQPAALLMPEGPNPGSSQVNFANVPAVGTLSSGDLSAIAANGVVVGPALTEGQAAIKFAGAMYSSGTTPISADIVLAGIVEWQT